MEYSRRFIFELFRMLLVSFLGLHVLELIKNGFVSYFFDLNKLLYVLLVVGIIHLFTSQEEMPESSIGEKKFSIGATVIVSIILLCLFVYIIRGLDIAMIVVTVTSSVFVVMLILYNFYRNNDKQI